MYGAYRRINDYEVSLRVHTRMRYNNDLLFVAGTCIRDKQFGVNQRRKNDLTCDFINGIHVDFKLY